MIMYSAGITTAAGSLHPLFMHDNRCAACSTYIWSLFVDCSSKHAHGAQLTCREKHHAGRLLAMTMCLQAIHMCTTCACSLAYSFQHFHRLSSMVLSRLLSCSASFWTIVVGKFTVCVHHFAQVRLCRIAGAQNTAAVIVRAAGGPFTCCIAAANLLLSCLPIF